ncbi:MAG: CoA-binding protein, partial [Bacteroidetes bacterium]|nr:CoA-binding protein [Bacteroidota bacterium]
QFPESAARALGAIREARKWRSRKILPQYNLQYNREKAREIFDGYIKEGKTTLGELDGNAILECYGFNTLQMELAKNKKQAVKIAETIGFPVVMKIVSNDILHKSDAGGVIVGLESKKEVGAAFGKIMDKAHDYDPDAILEGVLVQKMVPQGREVILGVSRDPQFGHAIMFGLGGIFVEVY